MTGPSPLLSRPGAVAADPPDEGVAAHYGDPYAEQRAAVSGAGLTDRGNRGVLRIAGPDRLTWLHSLTTQHLTGLAAGTGAHALVLSPHGHVEHDLRLADDGEATWVDVEPGTATDLLAFLESMRFLLRVEPADVTAGHAVLSLTGPATPEVLRAAGAAVPGTPGAVVPNPWGGWSRCGTAPLDPEADVLVARERLPEAWDALVAAGAAPLGLLGWEALRVAAGEPRLGRDTDHRTLPHELGWLRRAVHLDKGCYRGQETVARVHNLGRPPRRLVLLHLDGSESALPRKGDPVTWDGAAVGVVGTAVRHHELGPLALALVRRSTPDDAPLSAGGVAARIDPDRSVQPPPPAVTRR